MFPTLLSFGQERMSTLLDGNGTKGAFGSPFLEGSSINGQFSAYIGGGGAVIYDGFFLGGYGIGNSFAETTVDEESYEIKFKQGGLWLGYAVKDYKMVHTYTSLRIGWGKTKLRPTRGVYRNRGKERSGIRSNVFTADVALVAGYDEAGG